MLMYTYVHTYTHARTNIHVSVQNNYFTLLGHNDQPI